MTRPRSPSNSVTLPATPRWSIPSTASPASSNAVASRAWRVSSSPTPSSSSTRAWRGRASFSMSMWASSATNEPSSSSPSGLISASVMSRSTNSRASAVRIGTSRLSWRPVTPDGGDDLLGLVVAQRQDVREVPAADVVGMALGHLLDVDAAHVAEQHHRLLADPVPHHAGVVLLLDAGLGVDEHPARHVAVDLQAEDVLGLLAPPRRGCRRTARRRPSCARPVRTWDLMTTGSPMRIAISRASCGVVAKP